METESDGMQVRRSQRRCDTIASSHLRQKAPQPALWNGRRREIKDWSAAKYRELQQSRPRATNTVDRFSSTGSEADGSLTPPPPRPPSPRDISWEKHAVCFPWEALFWIGKKKKTEIILSHFARLSGNIPSEPLVALHCSISKRTHLPWRGVSGKSCFF